ncbi:phosphoribosyltransferase [Chitiniphilus eburneus]|uniref:Phosphoribosyltransferase n=1 Tax=Chitiniphilus eburneus TaxID=2571148 RepID=A0A4U0PNM7_9NEIS|nr:phosphoribosyltransferase [Chitiniphilus eburneus]TJZ69757.1 phosphoribosyltransferase [Chitiniphilus eburneus]
MSSFKLERIDQLSLRQYHYLDASDVCYCFGEYFPRDGYSKPMNGLIQNLKKPMERRGKPEWRYKADAINTASRLLGSIGSAFSDSVTFIPTPSSKCRQDPNFDDRIEQVLIRSFGSRPNFDMRQIIIQQQNRPPLHGGARRDINALRAGLAFDEAMLTSPPRQSIVIFDDVITTGCTFKAMKSMLQDRFGKQIEVVGLFLARTVHLDPDVGVFENLDDI